ncbi:cytochrome b5-like [Actinia tenebrosa]|uniref:Cytochrome b5 n=1 Tax=Actinia tenebrosa TaxID=6105 RepID=A0A6P8H6I2_ACTTE|nr:cytochrome b5-like [Actinia tenebrosa]
MADEKKEMQKLTFEEVKDHNKAGKCWVVIHDNVYDVTKFLDEHPGGEEVLLEQAGGDATESFEDVGHSSDARDLMKDYHIGELVEEDKRDNVPSKKPNYGDETKKESGSSWLSILLPAAIVVTIAMISYKLFM